jgi:L-fuculose-phosphate aldolase
MAGLGLVIGGFGNVSCRQEDTILITPTCLDYSRMEPADLVTLDMAGKKLAGGQEPSSEFRLHVAIYGARPDAQAIVHTHSAHALALSLVATELPMLTEEIETVIKGPVPVAPFVPAGTQELADQAADILQGIPSKALILARHGVVGFGRSLGDALLICQLVERNAKIYLLTQPR